MPSTTGIELGPESCVLVGVRPRRGGVADVTALHVIDTNEWPGYDAALTEMLRAARQSKRLPRRARVVVWGLPAAAEADDPVTRAMLRPLVEAGFRIETSLTPPQALAVLAANRPRASGSPTVAWLALNMYGAAIAIVSAGELLYSRSLDWSYDRRLTGPKAQLQRYSLIAHLGPELRRGVIMVSSSHGVTVDTAVTCGDLPELRSLTMPLIEELRDLDIEVETLDSTEGLRAVGRAKSERFADSAPAIRLACAAALARPKRWGVPVQSLARAAAAVMAIAALGWGGYAYWQRSEVRPAIPAQESSQASRPRVQQPSQQAPRQQAPPPGAANTPAASSARNQPPPVPPPVSRPTAVTSPPPVAVGQVSRGTPPAKPQDERPLPPSGAGGIPKSSPPRSAQVEPPKSTPASAPKVAASPAPTPFPPQTRLEPPKSKPPDASRGAGPPVTAPPPATQTRVESPRPAQPGTGARPGTSAPAAPQTKLEPPRAAQPGTGPRPVASTAPTAQTKLEPPVPVQRNSGRATAQSPATTPAARETKSEGKPVPTAAAKAVTTDSGRTPQPTTSARAETSPSPTLPPPAPSVAPAAGPSVVARTPSAGRVVPPPATVEAPLPSRSESTATRTIERPPNTIPVVATRRQVPLREPLPTVDSILIDQERRLAIIDGTIVSIGDLVGARVVVQIERDVVVLREPSGLAVRAVLRARTAS